jgi:hypothetical protein
MTGGTSHPGRIIDVAVIVWVLLYSVQERAHVFAKVCLYAGIKSQRSESSGVSYELSMSTQDIATSYVEYLTAAAKTW